MKKNTILALFAGLVALASLLLAADAPAPTVEPYLARIQTDPNATPATATAFFGETTTINGVKFEAPWKSVSWALADETKTVTVGGTTMTYAQVSAFVVAIAYQEKTDQSAPPPPPQ